MKKIKPIYLLVSFLLILVWATGANYINYKHQQDKKAYLELQQINLAPQKVEELLNNFELRLVENLSLYSLLVLLAGLIVFVLLNRHQQLKIAATAFDVQEGIIITDVQGRIIRANQSFSDITGYSQEEVIGKTPAILSSGKQDKEFYRIMWKTLLESGSWRGEIWNRKKNGEFYAEWLTITAVRNIHGKITHFIGAFLDITQRKEDEEQIRRLAFYDSLTELPNRRLFLDRLQHAISTSTRTQRHGAVLFIDLDNFKTLNDTKGHDVGDELLVKVGKRLLKEVRESDTVARFGGDEFIVLLENLNKNLQKSVLEVEFIAEEMRVSLNQPYTFGDFIHFSSPSIGIALFQGNKYSYDEVLKRADNAMYQAKSAGRNTIRIFDPAMQKEAEEKAHLTEELRNALAKDELSLYYQPQFNCTKGVVGAEALLRWIHPELGFISPEIFIPLAEQSGLIHDLGSWVLQHSCKTLAKWQTIPEFSHLTMAVNISARQLHRDDFITCIKHWIYHYEIPANLLVLEITESMLLKDMDTIIQKLEALREIGVIFSMDDFGTGYSSLSNLSQLPVDEVKIDKSFIHSMHEKPANMELVQAIVAMSHALGLKVLAEGIEDKEQQTSLEEMKCFDYQGYLYAKPMPYDELETFLKENIQGENPCQC